MTDSVRIRLDLSHLPLAARQQIPIPWGGGVADQDGVSYRHPGPRPIDLPSPLADTKVQLIVRPERLDGSSGEEIDVARYIDADLNIPNATRGHNLEHGTSVFAAALVALWLLKIWLARSGVPREALDLLTADHVTLRGVTLTYLIQCPSPEAVRELVQDIQVTARILRKNTRAFASTNETVKMPTGPGWLVAYWKTVLATCAFPAGAPQAEIEAANALIARIEAVLTGAFLRNEGLDRLDAWRNGYETGLYEKLFERAVRQPLRLGLRHNRPRPEVCNMLKGNAREFLDWYLAGNDPELFPTVLASAFPAQIKSKLHRALLEVGVDSNIRWIDHQRLRCFKLRDTLIYPGDYHPPRERAAWCFCLESWPALVAVLEREFEEAVSRWSTTKSQPAVSARC